MKLKELTNQEFQLFTDQFPLSSVFETPEYAMVMNKQNYDSFYLGMVDDNGNILAASLILVELLGKFQYAYAPRGYIMNFQDHQLLKEFTEQIKKFLKKKNIMAIKISPILPRTILKFDSKQKIEITSYQDTFNYLKKLGYYHLGYNRFFEAFKPRFEAIIELTNPSTMFKRIKKEYRTKIRTADASGIRIYRGTSENLSYFYEMTKNKYPRNLRYFQDVYELYQKRNMVDLYFALLDTKRFLISTQQKLQKQTLITNQVTEIIFNNHGKANNKLITKKITEDNKLADCKNKLIYATSLLNRNPDGVILACAMVVKYKQEAYLLMDGHESAYKSLNAKHLLIWKLMEKYSHEGILRFNLGGVADPENAEEYKGLNNFRMNFGADVTEYMGDLELITSKPLYMMYRNMSPFRNKKKKTENKK